MYRSIVYFWRFVQGSQYSVKSKPGSGFFRAASLTQAKILTDFQMLARHASTKTKPFSEGKIISAYHYIITAEPKEPKQRIMTELNRALSLNKDSLVFLTQKTRLTDSKTFKTIDPASFGGEEFMLKLIKEPWMPDAGHTCIAITDDNGEILKESEVSLKPSKTIVISADTQMHKHLHPSALLGKITTSEFTSIDEELALLAKNMSIDPSITANITAIPLNEGHLSLSALMKNIRSAKALKLYNLCSSVVKKQDIDKITDQDIKKAIRDLTAQAKQIPELKEIIVAENEEAIAALACTHAIVKACFGDSHIMDKEHGPDQPTQTAVVYCVRALIGSEKFEAFAKSIGFLDDVSDKFQPTKK